MKGSGMFTSKASEEAVARLVDALVRTNRMLVEQNADMHKRLMVRYPADFGQFLQAEGAAARGGEARRQAATEPVEGGETEKPMPEDIGLSGVRKFFSPAQDAALHEKEAV